MLKGIHRVSVDGGPLQTITVADSAEGELGRTSPEPLPGNKGLLLTVWRASGTAGKSLAVLELDTGELGILAKGVPFGRYVPTGHLVYPQLGRLMAMPFDVDTLSPTGDPVDVTERGMGIGGRDPHEWSFSQDGTLIYAPVRTPFDFGVELVLVDREGNEELIDARIPSVNSRSRLSPDGRFLALPVFDDETGEHEIWIQELQSNRSRRLTSTLGLDTQPVWTPDGRRIAFSSTRHGGMNNIYWMDAEGGEDVQRLTEREYLNAPGCWHPDGKILFYTEGGNPERGADIFSLNIEADPAKPIPLLTTPFNEMWPAISPDGAHLAYCSNKARLSQVYVRPYPDLDREMAVSIEGGAYPVWHPQGSSIFFFDLKGRVMEAELSFDPELEVESPKVLFEGPHILPGSTVMLDIAPDGDRFLLAKFPPQEEVTELIVVENWFEELKRLCPTGN
jgi:serine/threonine-protein kinase